MKDFQYGSAIDSGEQGASDDDGCLQADELCGRSSFVLGSRHGFGMESKNAKKGEKL